MADPVTYNQFTPNTAPSPEGEQIRTQRERDRSSGNKSNGGNDSYVPHGNTRSILSPSSLIQTAAVPAGLASGNDRFVNANKAWDSTKYNGKNIPQLEQECVTKVNNLNTELTGQRQALNQAAQELATKEPALVADRVRQEHNVQTTTAEATTRETELKAAEKAKTQAERAVKLAKKDLENAVPQPLKDEIKKRTTALKKAEKYLEKVEDNPQRAGIAKRNLDTAQKRLTEAEKWAETAKANDTARVDTIRNAQRTKNTSNLGVVNKEKQLTRAVGRQQAAETELTTLKGELRTLRKAPHRAASRIRELESGITQANTELSTGVTAARQARVTAVGDTFKGAEGYLARGMANSDEFAMFATSTTKTTERAAQFLSKIPMLGTILEFAGKILAPIGAGFAALDVGKELYNAFCANDEEKSKAWTFATLNSILTIGTGVIGLAMGGWVPAMIALGTGNLIYTLGKSIYNADFKNMFNWLWGTT